MASGEVAARLRYLDESAHLLEATSKSTSSYLMSQRNGLMSDKKIDQPPATKRSVCNACGNIMIIGQTATVKLSRSTLPRTKNSARGVHQDQTKAVVYCCRLCGRQTEHTLEKQLPKAVRKAGTSSGHHDGHAALKPSVSLARPLRDAQRAPDANANSKKRTKTRKSSSLQAILAARNESSHKPPGSGFGMSLLDLMKQP